MNNLILILGFGRMGFSHAVQLNASSAENPEFHIIDPSFLSRLLAKLMLPNCKTYRSLESYLVSRSDARVRYAVVCTPPFQRELEIDNIKDLCNFMLIEKPVLEFLPQNAMSGYVMQHCPILNLVSEEIKSLPSRIDVACHSNIDFESNDNGWRSYIESPLANEFFGHCVTFGISPLYLAGYNFENFKLIRVYEKSSNKLKIECSLGEIKLIINLCGKQNVRKTLYKSEYHYNDSTLSFDPYTINLPNNSRIHVTESDTQVSFFLRGFEFARQSDRLLDGKGDIIPGFLLKQLEEVIKSI